MDCCASISVAFPVVLTHPEPHESLPPCSLSWWFLSRPGADVVFDPVGGALFDEALKSAAPWGAHYLVVGFAAGAIPKVRRLEFIVRTTMVTMFVAGVPQGACCNCR